jgi:hypothetical protein
MQKSPRGGYDHGHKPARPGDATGRKYNEDLQKQEAEKRLKENPPDPDEAHKAAYMDGWHAGYEVGVEAVLKQLRDAGLDLDAEDEDDDTEGAE